jgi:hypothetical protein
VVVVVAAAVLLPPPFAVRHAGRLLPRGRRLLSSNWTVDGRDRLRNT